MMPIFRGGNPSQRSIPDPAVVDSIFRALSDPTRRNVLERLSMGPSSVTDLASSYNMALPSFVGHLKLLEESGLVTSRKTGRVRICELAPDQVKVAEDWLGHQRAVWERRLDQLDSYLLKLKDKESK